VVDVEHDADVAGVHALDIHKDRREMVVEAVAAIELEAFDLTEGVN
jgi:hypothetical protein